MSKKLSLIVSMSGKTTAIPNRISTGARSSHAAGASLSRRPRATSRLSPIVAREQSQGGGLA